MPLVSVVLPTYNGSAFIAQTIDSILNQTFKDLELIVVIDGSTDDTESILATYSDPRIRVLKHAENQGQAPAMNTGFDAAEGEYWTWSSDDNVYFPDAIETMVNYLEAHRETSAVSTDGISIDEKNNLLYYREFMWQCFLFRARIREQVGRHSVEERILEDIAYALRVQHFAGPIARISEPYIYYRIHRQSVSTRRASELPIVSAKLRYQFITEGIVDEPMDEMFLVRLSRSALYRDWKTMWEIVEFAREKDLPFVPELEKKARWLRTPWGRVVNRLRILAVGRTEALKRRLRLYGYLTRCKMSGRSVQRRGRHTGEENG